ncbi:phage terminase small subunit [Erwinia rhapontici]|uniref:phage terminase small subunit n=1 Tax=Erwinia rhapontici TaxID=55212 RepID=UPI00105B65BE|nr:phage terminase small subunit [Erwinia rhapontici]NKG32818.1 terminase [Erwinia rhapontici]TDS93420.1 small terminase subunit [Erwinia rhapontici]
MLTPAKRHFQNVMAQNRGNGVTTFADMTAYEQILHRLRIDMNRLKGIQRKETKAEEKQKLLPDYQGWIDGTLAADSGQADEVLTRVMLWHIDAGNIAEALRIGEYVIRHQLAMPDLFQRTAAVTLIDEICDPVLAAFKAQANVATVSVDLLKALDGLTTGQDVPEQVRAKLWKAIGYTLRTAPETQPEALEYLQKAIGEFSDIGVKRDIEQLERLLKKTALIEAAGAGSDGDSGQKTEIPTSAVTAVTVIDGDQTANTLVPVVDVIAVPEVSTETAPEPEVKPAVKRGRPAGVKKPAAAKNKTAAAGKKAAAAK